MKDFTGLLEVLNSIPKVKDLLQMPDLQAGLDARHPRAFRLLRWISSSNRAHLVRLEPSKVIQEFVTPNQFYFLSTPPEKEQAFKALRRQHGSFFAIHGSPLECWHSILRVGLRNASNTAYMTTGAAYGSGIYLSPSAATSAAYMQRQQTPGWRLSAFAGGNIQVMAVCEVVDHPQLAGQPNPHYVVPNPDWVVTRLLLVITDTKAPQIELKRNSPLNAALRSLAASFS
eukprot:tig00021537_g22315.t1